jgi:hypothetical protein
MIMLYSIYGTKILDKFTQSMINISFSSYRCCPSLRVIFFNLLAFVGACIA